MRVERLEIEDVLLIKPEVFGDDRGYFFESFNKKAFSEVATGNIEFVQDNQSMSKRHVLRGMHYQLPPFAQGKLVRCVDGEIFDVAVDIRKASSSFGSWVGRKLSGANQKQLWIPPGFAHGFLTLSDRAIVAYKTTEFYDANSESSISYADQSIGIKWPEQATPILSKKDSCAPLLSEAPVFDR